MKKASKPKIPAKKAAAPPAAIAATPVLVDEKKKRPTMPIVKDGKLKLSTDQADSLAKSKYESTTMAIIDSAIAGVMKGGADVVFNGALQQMDELEPGSYLESMLLAQMIQTSNGAKFCMNLAFSEGQHPAAREMNANLAIKFQRTFTAQIEALQKIRGKGGQQVRVEHVHVHEGGQAIVGNVNQGTDAGGRGQNGKL